MSDGLGGCWFQVCFAEEVVFVYFGGGGGLAVAGYEHVDGGDYEEGEEGAYDHAGYEDVADAVAAAGAGASCEDQWEVAGDRGYGGHENGAEPGAGGFDYGAQFIHAGFLEFVGEFYDEDAVF